MIYSFSVENYLSIKEKQTLSFATTPDKTMRDLMSVEVKPGCYVNKLAIFYGANASGKSNILYAMDSALKLMVAWCRKKSDTIPVYHPFALYKGMPTQFELTFFKEGVQYDYRVEYVATHIMEEELVYYPKRGKALFYKRRFTGENTRPDIEFGSTLKLHQDTKQSLREHTFNNHSVLGTFGKLSLNEDAVPFAELTNWVMTYVHDVYDDAKGRNIVADLYRISQDPDKKEFYLQLLAKADFNIIDFSVMDNVSKLPKDTIELITKSSMDEDEKVAFLKDVLFKNHAEEGDFDVATRFQSLGTLRYVELLDFLYDMVTGNHIYFLDEISNKLHYDLFVYYLELFLYNSDRSQLFFTTHNYLLLDEEFMRRDVVWLAEKRLDSASTEYTRVSDMGLHKNLSLFNAYRIGKLGAKPDLGSPYLNLSTNIKREESYERNDSGDR